MEIKSQINFLYLTLCMCRSCKHLVFEWNPETRAPSIWRGLKEVCWCSLRRHSYWLPIVTSCRIFLYINNWAILNLKSRVCSFHSSWQSCLIKFILSIQHLKKHIFLLWCSTCVCVCVELQTIMIMSCQETGGGPLETVREKQINAEKEKWQQRAELRAPRRFSVWWMRSGILE